MPSSLLNLKGYLPPAKPSLSARASSARARSDIAAQASLHLLLSKGVILYSSLHSNPVLKILLYLCYLLHTEAFDTFANSPGRVIWGVGEHDFPDLKPP